MKAFSKDVVRTIGSSKKRFFSIMAICALGVTMFVGLAVACIDLRKSADAFFDDQALFDLSVMSTLGMTDDDVAALAALDGVAVAEGSYEASVHTDVGGHLEQADVKALSDAGINEPYVVEGRLPQDAAEVAVTQAYLNDSGKQVGDTLTFTLDDEGSDGASEDDADESSEETGSDGADASADASGEPMFSDDATYTIVGAVVDPTNVVSPEGATSLRNSTTSDYVFYLTRAAAQGDVYAAVYLLVSDAEELACYSDAYSDRVEEVQDGVLAIQAEREAARADELRADALTEIDDAQATLDAEMADAQAQIDAGWQQVNDSRAALDAQAANYAYLPADAQAQIDAGYAQISQSEADLQASQAELDAQRADAQADIDEARADAQALEASWYIQDRMSLVGYSSVDSDATSIETIAAVLPVIFLVVAVLVSLTTAMRMVEEQRGLIGIYKALGYSNARIMGKYAVYVFAASFIGSVLGDVVGFFALPEFLFGIFRTMYLLPTYDFAFDVMYAVGGVALFVVAITGATMFACRRDLRQTPAELMRPKAPKAGKRILLERIGPLWRRMSFLNKVTARNLFRYKARFFMTVFGILGCTMLLVCGFAIKNTVDSLPARQYDGVYGYDLMAVTLADDLAAARTDLEARDGVDGLMELSVDNATLINGSDRSSMQLYVVPDGFSLAGYVQLEDADGATIELPESGIVATDNAAKILGFAVGDEVELRTSALDEEVLTVEAVTVNYLGNAVYMTQEAYEKAFGAAYEPNALLVQLSGDAAAQVSFADELGADDTYLSITSIEKMRGDFSSAFALINGIVYLVIALAAGLAFVVLFTLSTTNISERERELATLKVLGFRRGEVRRYVNKETMVLTLLGVAFGLPAGWLLSYSFRFLLSLPAISFATYVNPWTYLIATGITLVFAFLVSLVTNRMLDRIDMVEALKSPE